MIRPAPAAASSPWDLALVSASMAADRPGTPSELDRDPSGWTDLLAEGGPGAEGLDPDHAQARPTSSSPSRNGRSTPRPAS